MKIIKWGIIGTGKISSKFATALNALENTIIWAVASRDLDRAKEFGNRFQIEKSYGSYEEMVKDPEIDVIYIGTPHTEHKANAELCIKHGKAVLCEKPFTINETDTRYLISLAKEYNVFLMEAMWTKFLPITKIVHKWIEDKVIGDIKYFDVSFGFQGKYEPENRLYNPKLAGGALLDVGIYPITYVVHMLGGKIPDYITSTAYLGKTGVDEINAIIMRYDNGVIANLTSSISTNFDNNAIIIGTEGKIVIPNFWSANHAKLYDAYGNLLEEQSETFIANGYEYEAQEVNCCIGEGFKESSYLPLVNTLDIIKLMDEIRKQWGLKYPQEHNEI